MKNKFTPGPWTVQTQQLGTSTHAHNEFLINHGELVERETLKANAALIACSPEMFGLLVDIAQHLKRGDDILVKRDAIVLNKIKALILKATGS